MSTETTDRVLSALERVAYLQDRGLYPSQRTAAFLNAAEVIRGLADGELEARLEAGSLTELSGVGASTAEVAIQASAGEVPDRIARLETETEIPVGAGAALRTELRGDCHAHSTWSDGGAGIAAMAATAGDLGHDYLVITDHSPRLTVAHGLNRERLEAQLDEIEALAGDLAPFRILTGIEVDILDDGGLDQAPDLLDRLDVVVASVHSKLSMPAEDMTRRMVAAVANPRVDILGHCTGRKVKGRGTDQRVVRPPASFDAEVVFAACARFDTAVEINCRPERQDPPAELLDLALDWDCRLAIDTDAHAPGQLEWQPYGCDAAAELGVAPGRVVNAMSADDLVAWAAAHHD